MDKYKKLVFLLIGIVSSAFFVGVHTFGLFSGFENIFEDRLFSEKAVDNRIVIVAIDDESLSELGQWPWPRSVFADFFRTLKKSSPKVVGLDVMLSERSWLGSADDENLVAALHDVSYSVVMPVEKKEGADFLAPLSKFVSAEHVELGHVNLIVDDDNSVRALPHIFFEDDGAVVYPFSEKIAEIAGAVAENRGERIVYAGRTGVFPTISFSDVSQKEPSFFKNKIVLVGATAPDLHDEQRTPVFSGGLMPGVEIQAHIVNMLLRGYSLKGAGHLFSIFLIFSASIVLVFLFSFFENIKILFTGIIFIFAVVLVGGIVSFENGIAIRFVDLFGVVFIGSVLMFGYKHVVSEKHKRELKKVFSKYVSPQVLSKILIAPEKVSLGGEERTVTVLFSDIRGFTSLSEVTTPAELVEILNEYFTEMTDEILKQDGVLDKYIGDAIMAFWGAPIEDEAQADRAVNAALGMVWRLREFNKKLKERGRPEIKNGVGIYTGPAVVGNVGSKDRFDYTVIGDTVNTASRLESATKELGVAVVIGASTKNALKENHDIKDLGVVKVKGKSEGLQVYAVLQ